MNVVYNDRYFTEGLLRFDELCWQILQSLAIIRGSSEVAKTVAQTTN